MNLKDLTLYKKKEKEHTTARWSRKLILFDFRCNLNTNSMSSNQSLLKMIFLIRCKHWNTLNSEKEDLFSLENSKDAPKKSNQSKQLEPLKYEKKIRVVCENILQFQ